MGELTNQPDFPVDFLRPTRIRFDNVGNSIDGGINGVGEAISMETSGGGMMTATMENMVLEGPDERFEVLPWLGARLNGGFRNIVVPLVNDKVGGFPDGRPIFRSIFRPDGSLISDGSSYTEATVYGQMTAAAALNAGVLSIRVFGAARKMFRHSDWFSIQHPTKGWRIYRSWELISQTNEENPISRIAISPPLREAVSPGDRVEFARPRCVMKLSRGSTVPFEYQGFYSARPSISFVEAF